MSDQIDAYSKIEDDALMLLKADKTELDSYIDLKSTQAIVGQKQFGIISVSNDTGLRALQTELSDMSNVMTILGTATGGCNAMTDLLLDGNTLISAKNNSFVRTSYDENIGVLFAPVMVLRIEDDALLLLKSDQIKLIDASNQTEVDALLDDKLKISNYNDSYSKIEDDALLLMKPDKSQLIVAQTKGETNYLLNNKVNSGVSYTQQEDYALLQQKADKTQLTDAYTKEDVDNLLNNKVNSGVSYSKQEDDALLLLKADKTQLIDSYTKQKTNIPINNNADSGVQYTNEEDDAPVIVAIPSIEHTNLQLLLNIIFAFIVYAVSQFIQQFKSISPNSTYEINYSVSILVQVVDQFAFNNNNASSSSLVYQTHESA
ncbi:MAG: hypothetical protein EZS28_035238, partial [Streblomastix strix]